MSELSKIYNEFKERYDFCLSGAELLDLTDHTIRKLRVINKADDYLPLLFENELHDYMVRHCINLIGGTA